MYFMSENSAENFIYSIFLSSYNNIAGVVNPHFTDKKMSLRV